MKELKCVSCQGTEFKKHKFGIKCSYCGTIYKDKDLVTEVRTVVHADAPRYSYTSSVMYPFPTASYLTPYDARR